MRLLTGLRAWTLQRATAVLMLGFLLWLAAALLVSPPDGYDRWRAMVAQPLTSTAFAVFFAAVLFHTWVGVRDVVLDYIHAPRTRAAVLGVVIGALLAIGLWLGFALAELHIR